EIVRRLRSVAEWQLRFRVELSRLFHSRDEVADRQLTQRVSGARRLAHVPVYQFAVGSAHAGERRLLAGTDGLIDVNARVRLAPAKDWDMQHGSILRFMNSDL